MMMSLLSCLKLKQSWGRWEITENSCTPLSISSLQQIRNNLSLLPENRAYCIITFLRWAPLPVLVKLLFIRSPKKPLFCLNVSVNYHRQHAHWFHSFWSKKASGLCSLDTASTTEKKRTRGRFTRVQHQDNFVSTVLLKNRFHASEREYNHEGKHMLRNLKTMLYNTAQQQHAASFLESLPAEMKAELCGLSVPSAACTCRSSMARTSTRFRLAGSSSSSVTAWGPADLCLCTCVGVSVPPGDRPFPRSAAAVALLVTHKMDEWGRRRAALVWGEWLWSSMVVGFGPVYRLTLCPLGVWVCG